MLNRALAFSVTLLIAGAATIVSATGAAADGSLCGHTACDTAEGHSSGGTVSVTVTGTGTSTGGSYTIPEQHLTTPPVCYYDFLMTGKEYAAVWGPGGSFTQLQHNLPEEDRFSPEPHYQDHKDDDEGGYWYPYCDVQRWTGTTDGYNAAWKQYYGTHDTVYVEADDTPPTDVEVPPEELARIAYKATTLPDGHIRWNPSRTDDGATFVGLDTWVWLDDPTTSVSVTATIPSGTSATVTATLDDMVVGADGARTTDCGGPGVAWTAGAEHTPCAITFDRSSANLPVKAGHDEPTATMTAVSTWRASWTSNRDPGTHDLANLTRTATAEVPVAEIQSVVSGS
ncbi:hypothetical protein [Cellulomonas sp. PhB150]|uniref:hypothetical protein n=1 Tax=Cellulomonas sp. PhB150 TaxID=2485188 RepID=UPI000F475617|nr:hypothetical protein [Cellulomonas sp. PhB150]ROS23833.1 hypothetical protein EDF34_2895 [Cellulomonas sp. PhB150]